MTDLEDLLVYAKTVWGEARGETISGMLGVAWTIKRRTERAQWPDNIIDVCLQPWQFSVWNRSDPNFNKVIGAPLTSKSFQRAIFVVLGVTLGYLADPTNGADHYHHKDIEPPWAKEMTKTAEIGSHIFYNSEE